MSKTNSIRKLPCRTTPPQYEVRCQTRVLGIAYQRGALFEFKGHELTKRQLLAKAHKL